MTAAKWPACLRIAVFTSCSSFTVAGTSETLREEPSALRSLRSQSTVFCSACAFAAADGWARSKPCGAASGTVRRSGGCWVSHGTSARSGGRAWFLGVGRVDALQRLAGEEELVGPHRVGELRRGEHDAEPLAVGVARAALAGEAGQRLGRLLVDRAVGGERLVVDLVLGPGQDHVVLAARGLRELVVERHRALVERGQRGHERAQVVREAAQLGLGHEAARLPDEGHARVDRGARGAHGRARRADQAAHGGERAVQGAQRGHRRVERARQLADGGRELLLAGGEGAGGRVEVGHERLELLAVAVDRLGGGAGLVDVAPEVAGLRALGARRRRSRCRGRRASSRGSTRCSRGRPCPSGPRTARAAAPGGPCASAPAAR